VIGGGIVPEVAGAAGVVTLTGVGGNGGRLATGTDFAGSGGGAVGVVVLDFAAFGATLASGGFAGGCSTTDAAGV
jgi:hypothetical protein